MLPLIESFFKVLEKEGVAYCHWKSNAFLAAAARGEDDLDILIGRESRQAFLGILDRFGFKEAGISRGWRRIPGILDYYGFDETAGRLVHIHAHYKLILGHDLNKNYHLPVESAYLDSSVPGEFCRIPSPEFELVVLVVRMMLKHSTWNAVLGGEGKLSGREREEMEYLREKASRERLDDVLAKHLPSLEGELFEDCLRSLQPGRPSRFRVRSARRLQKALRGCRLRPAGLDIWLQFRRRLEMAARRRLPGGIPGKRMKNGGLLVGFVGGDGAGKSTVIEDISKWLFPPFETRTVHLGKPSWSASTRLARGIMKAGRLLGLGAFKRMPLDLQGGENPPSFPGYPSLVDAVCAARDRSRSYKKARKLADKGLLVICDRFPLPRLIAMDGPRIERMAGLHPRKRLVGFLGKREKRYYRSISPPDLLFVLKVDPETAVRRKADESAASVRARAEEVRQKDWEGLGACLVDANQPQAEVLRRTKALLWANI